MKIFREYTQSQGLLLPPSLDEFVPESRLMKDSRGVIQPSYNGQIAVDDKERDTADADYSSYDILEYGEGKKLDMYMPDNFLEALDEKEETS